MEAAQIVSCIVGIIVVIVAAVGGTFFAMAKWGFVSSDECLLHRTECHNTCATVTSKSKEALSYKLDRICEELAKLRILMDKDSERYVTLNRFLGKVEEFMESHKGV